MAMLPTPSCPRVSCAEPGRNYHQVPAGLASPGLGVVHDIVRDEEVRLQELHGPAENGGALVRRIVGRARPRQDAVRVQHGQPAVQLAANCVVQQTLVRFNTAPAPHAIPACTIAQPRRGS